LPRSMGRPWEKTDSNRCGVMIALVCGGPRNPSLLCWPRRPSFELRAPRSLVLRQLTGAWRTTQFEISSGLVTKPCRGRLGFRKMLAFVGQTDPGNWEKSIAGAHRRRPALWRRTRPGLPRTIKGSGPDRTGWPRIMAGKCRRSATLVQQDHFAKLGPVWAPAGPRLRPKPPGQTAACPRRGAGPRKYAKFLFISWAQAVVGPVMEA